MSDVTRRPFEDTSKPGRLDVFGQEWWACDPYPTWFFWRDGELHKPNEPIRWADEVPDVRLLTDHLWDFPFSQKAKCDQKTAVPMNQEVVHATHEELSGGEPATDKLQPHDC